MILCHKVKNVINLITCQVGEYVVIIFHKFVIVECHFCKLLYIFFVVVSLQFVLRQKSKGKKKYCWLLRLNWNRFDAIARIHFTQMNWTGEDDRHCSTVFGCKPDTMKKKESAKKDTRLGNFDTYTHDKKEKKYNAHTNFGYRMRNWIRWEWEKWRKHIHIKIYKKKVTRDSLPFYRNQVLWFIFISPCDLQVFLELFVIDYIMYGFFIFQFTVIPIKISCRSVSFLFYPSPPIYRTGFEYAMRNMAMAIAKWTNRNKKRGKEVIIGCRLFWYVWLQKVFIATTIIQVWTNRYLSPPSKTTMMTLILWWLTIPRAYNTIHTISTAYDCENTSINLKEKKSVVFYRFFFHFLRDSIVEWSSFGSRCKYR